MRTRILGVTVIAAMALVACGSDDDGGSDGPQDEVAVLFAGAMEDQDIAIDLGCAKEAAADLSDEDAQAIVDAGVDAGADFSPAATEFAERAASCIDMDALVDQMVDLLGEDLVDGDCLKEALKDVDPAVLGSGDLPPEAEACFSD